MHLTESPKLIQPRDHKAKISIWADLAVSDMDIIAEAVTPDQVKIELGRIFHLDDYKDNMKTGILLDLYTYTIQFARDHMFNKEQTSAFFSIVKQTHEVAVETPFGNVEQTFRYFRELVLCHAVKRPPYSIDLFTPDHVAQITDYVVNTYFRHFKMYKYAFTPMVRLDLTINYIGMPESPPPSESGDIEGQEVGAEGEGGTEAGEGGDTPTEQEGEVAVEVTPDSEEKREESPAAKELRGLIREHLSEEMKKLKLDVEGQIKESEETINKKLLSLEGSPGKGRVSAKGKKK